MMTTDAQTGLLDRFIRSQDAEAFALITRQYAGMVYGTCIRITGNEDRAADATRALPDDERAFAFDVESIDWRTYWIDVEVPGLRIWTFPLLDGREPPRDAPSATPARLLPSAALKEGVA